MMHILDTKQESLFSEGQVHSEKSGLLFLTKLVFSGFVPSATSRGDI